MDSNSIVLDGSVISAISKENDEVRIRFDPAYLVRIMTGSREQTRWQQQGELVFSGVTEFSTGNISFPVTCTGGDVTENVYTYRDMVPVPLNSRGLAGCDLLLEAKDEPVHVVAESVAVEMVDVPRYIEHIR